MSRDTGGPGTGIYTSELLKGQTGGRFAPFGSAQIAYDAYIPKLYPQAVQLATEMHRNGVLQKGQGSSGDDSSVTPLI